jgi:hypothetical protein
LLFQFNSLSSPVFLDAVDCFSVHYYLALVTPALLVFAWSDIDHFEVLFATLKASGSIHVVCGILCCEAVIEILVTFSLFDHLEDKTVTFAITTIFSTFIWCFPWFGLAPALELCIFHKVFLQAKSLSFAGRPLILESPLFICLPLSKFLKCVKIGIAVESIQETKVVCTVTLAGLLSTLLGCVTTFVNFVPLWLPDLSLFFEANIFKMISCLNFRSLSKSK